MKKVCIINSVFKKGSTGRMCFEMSEFLKSKGFDTLVCYGRDYVEGDNSFYFGSKISRNFHGLFSRIFDRHGLCSNIKTKKMIKKIKSFEPDIYILNNLHGYYLNYKIFLNFLRKENKPIIWIFHDCWNFTGHCAHFLYNGCNKWKTGCHNCAFLSSYPKSILFNSSKSNFKLKTTLILELENLQIVTPSNWLSGLVKSSALKCKKVTSIHNGIDLNVFRKRRNTSFRESNNFNNKKLILCAAYQFDKRKGLLDIIKLSDLLHEDEKIVLVGNIKDHNLKIPPNIFHIQKTDNMNELVDLYSSCDVFFNPTYEDNYPTVNLEAICCGLPVVSYNTGGSSEMIDKKFSVEPGNILGSLSLIRSLFINPKSYNFPNKQMFDKQHTYLKYLNLIERMLK